MVNIKKQLVQSRARVSNGKNSRKYITIHETANTSYGANAQVHANLQSNGNARQASWHYQVDDKQVIQSFPHTAICWHAGSWQGNTQSIGVEICVNRDGSFEKAVQNASDLLKRIMKQENIPLSNVIQHNHWSGKDCPAYLRSGTKGINWNQFKAKLTGTSTSASRYFYLKQGDVGERVRLYQDKLKRAGYKIDIDGSFGPAMLVVVKRFQSDNGLTVDGYLGPDTQKTLNNILIAMRSESKKEKEVDELTIYMNEKLPKTQQKDAADLFKKAHEDGYFSVNHAPKVKDMTRRQYLDLRESLQIREKLNKKVK